MSVVARRESTESGTFDSRAAYAVFAYAEG
jgi:hypothetical protein